jgi:hypothetical protein
MPLKINIVFDQQQTAPNLGCNKLNRTNRVNSVPETSLFINSAGKIKGVIYLNQRGDIPFTPQKHAIFTDR